MIHLLHLYPQELNLYGDHGNILCLKQRLAWRHIPVKVDAYEAGTPFPKQVDLIFGGGGQDSGQAKIIDDLLKQKNTLKQLLAEDVPALLVCGSYQLFGRFFASEHGSIAGLGLLDLTTRAGESRLVGNLHVQSERFGTLVGYENHAGRTKLGRDLVPLGQVTLGAGNNGEDEKEGAIFRNCIGTYLHGPLLPKNPRLADWLLTQAIRHADPTNKKHYLPLKPLDDSLENLARDAALKRPR